MEILKKIQTEMKLDMKRLINQMERLVEPQQYSGRQNITA